jgi:hypothetical protein
MTGEMPVPPKPEMLVKPRTGITKLFSILDRTDGQHLSVLTAQIFLRLLIFILVKFVRMDTVDDGAAQQ